MKRNTLFVIVSLLLVLSCVSQDKKASEASPVPAFEDVRGDNLSTKKVDQLRKVLPSLWFNRRTIWPKELQGEVEILLQQAMNSGLGIRSLHAEGITGKGVNVAIIDQNMMLKHSEYKSKIVKYFDTGCNQPRNESSMHAPAVVSILAGDSCGVAPGANVYVAAAPSWKKDSSYYAKALYWIIKENKKLQEGDKIRVVSVSASPSGKGSPFTKNQEMWEEACQLAKEEGILVLDCTADPVRGIISPCWRDPQDPDNFEKVETGFPSSKNKNNHIEGVLAPTSLRTTAEHYTPAEISYQYTGQGGLSWGIPYGAGVLALGWQINPDLSNKDAVQLLFDTAYIHKNGSKIINPQAFIQAVKKTKGL